MSTLYSFIFEHMYSIYIMVLISLFIYWYYRRIYKIKIEHFGMGPRGPQGIQGIQGIPGGSGGPGPIGPPGPSGNTGPEGRPGQIGPEGKIGIPGVRGEPGPMGPPGSRGFDGFPGPQGKDGRPGGPGPKGDIGKDGRPGIKGDKGRPGDRGWPGLKGDAGSFEENSCKYFGSDQETGWQCPDDYPVASGGTIGSGDSSLICTGGIAKNATCKSSAGFGAKANCFISASGEVTDIRIINPGQSYSNPPSIKFLGTGDGTIAQSIVANGQIIGIVIIDGGNNHQNPPDIQFETTDGGYGATADAIINNGQVIGLNISNPGQNYKQAPLVTFTGGNGSGALAITTINSGYVTSATITQNGSGYTIPPIVQIMPRPAQEGCTFCHLCCKKTAKQATPKIGELGYTPPLEDRLHKNETKINDIMDQIRDLKYYQLIQKQKMQTSEKPNKSNITPTLSDQQLNQPIIALPTDMKTNINRQQQQQLLAAQTQEAILAQMAQQPTNNINRQIGTPPLFSQKEQQLLQEYDQMLNNSQLNQEEKNIRRSLEEKRIKDVALNQPKDRNWALSGKATQSTTYQQYTAGLAIDGRIDTFNHTNMGISWWQVELSRPIAIRQIKITNRLGTFQIKSRLVPFRLIIINANGAVTEEKNYDEVKDNYIWDNIYQVGQIVRVELINNNYLHMAEVEIWGEEASDCASYQQKYNKLNQDINQRLLKYSSVPSDFNVRKDRMKTLYDSCIKLTPADQVKRTDLVEEQAKAYDDILAMRKKENDQKKQAAEAKMVEINAALKKEAEVAIQAKKLGLPPPPPQFTQADIAEVKKDLQSITMKPMTMEEKANCMTLLNEATNLRNKAEDTGRLSENLQFLIPAAKTANDSSEEAWRRYSETCEQKQI